MNGFDADGQSETFQLGQKRGSPHLQQLSRARLVPGTKGESLLKDLPFKARHRLIEIQSRARDMHGFFDMQRVGCAHGRKREIVLHQHSPVT